MWFVSAPASLEAESSFPASIHPLPWSETGGVTKAGYAANMGAMRKLKDLSAFRGSSSHKSMRDVLYHPPLVIGDPGFRYLLRGEARHDCGKTSWDADFNAKGQVLLRNDPIGSSYVRMLFRHILNMVRVAPMPIRPRGGARIAVAILSCVCVGRRRSVSKKCLIKARGNNKS